MRTSMILLRWGKVMGMTAEEIERNYRNFERRTETTEYLRTPPINDYIFI